MQKEEKYFLLQDKPPSSSYSLQCMLHCRYGVERGEGWGGAQGERRGAESMREGVCSMCGIVKSLHEKKNVNV